MIDDKSREQRLSVSRHSRRWRSVVDVVVHCHRSPFAFPACALFLSVPSDLVPDLDDNLNASPTFGGSEPRT